MSHVVSENNSYIKAKRVHELTERHVRIAMIVLCEAFTTFTLLRLIHDHEFNHILTCIVTFALILIPSIAEKLLSYSLNAVGCVLIHLYTISHMLGECYKLYYTTAYWDKLLHTSSGIIFALVGLYLIKRLCKNKASAVVCALFALCFSVTVSVFWEFAEFAGDQLFGMDMQNDTVITDINTYLLGDEPGEKGRIEGIYEVTVNGQVLPFEGYIDIGLIDTMTDMLVETIGALVVVILIFIQSKRQPQVNRSALFKLLNCGTPDESSD